MEVTKEYDFVSVGGGVAGLAAVQYAARAGLSSLLIDMSVSGGQVLTIPHLENYPGVFPALNGFDLSEKMQKQAESFGAQTMMTSVSSIDKIGNDFYIETGKGKIKARTLLIATGAEHKKLGVDGEEKFEGRGVSYCATCDGPLFKGKRIAVIGGGDSACDEAVYLATLSDKVTLIHRRDELRAQKAVADRVKSNKNITILYDTVVKKISGENKVEKLILQNVKTQSESELLCDGVFIFAGMAPRTDLVPMLKKDDGGYIITNEKMETEIPGLYAAGDIRSKPFRQIVTAVSDGAIAGHEAAAYLMR